jgi:xanthine dehydrogenase accessory factor
MNAERLRQVKAPAGINIGAGSPEEIAVSILAEIVQLNRSRVAEHKDTPVLPAEKQEVKDPICGMTVDVDTPKYESEFDGKSFYFCSAGCKQAFDGQPDKYVLANLPM